MPRSYASSVINADPDTVWGFLRDFDRTPDFIEAITSSEILDGKRADQVGCERALVLSDGSPVRERLVALSDLDRSYTYHLLEGPFPFTRYYSTVRVTPITEGGGSLVEWWSTYDCAAEHEQAMDELLAGTLYGGGLKAVQARLG